MKEKVSIAFIVSLVTVLAVLSFTGNSPRLGSVESTAGGYSATTTSSADGSVSTSYVACKGPSGATNCMLGHLVVVQPATVGHVRLWKATSTATSTYTGNPSGTFGEQIAFVNSATDAVGTLVFDQNVGPGLVIETSVDFNGEYVVTWKY